MSYIRMTMAASAALLTAISLASCSGSSSADEVETVDAAEFASGDRTVFRLEQDGTSCTLTAGEEAGNASMNCVLPLDDEVLDLEYGTPASAVYLSGDKGFLPTGGLEEKTADASATILHSDQRIKVAGITCTATAPYAVDCSHGDDTFSYDAGSFTSSAWRTPWTGIGDTCGDADEGKFPDLASTTTRVARGPVDCDEVMESLNDYLATPTDAHHGNTNLREVGEWTCSMPTWGTSQMNGLLVDCYQGHLNVTIPKPEPVICGDAERGRFSNLQDTEVTVTEGDVDCATAVDVFSSYLSSPKHPENSGNILSLDIDGWQCGSDIRMGGSNPDIPMFRCSQDDRTIVIQGR